mgnify:CR=1 FL=1
MQDEVALRRADGLRYYGAIVEALRRELDVAPSPATRELARLLRDEMAPAPSVAPRSAPMRRPTAWPRCSG